MTVWHQFATIRSEYKVQYNNNEKSKQLNSDYLMIHKIFNNIVVRLVLLASKILWNTSNECEEEAERWPVNVYNNDWVGVWVKFTKLQKMR